MKNILSNKIFIFLIIVFSLLIVLYTIMLLDTNQVVDDARNVMLGNVPENVTKGTALNRYNFSNDLLNAEVNVKITRFFVIHNFFDGFMYVKYTCETIKNDKDIKPSRWDIPSRWKIHRENDKWKIVEIKEDP